MKLELATKQYVEANKAPARLIEAAGEAIKAGREDWEKMLTAISTTLIEDFGNEIAEDLGAEKSIGEVRQLGSNTSEGKSSNGIPEPASTEFKWTFDPMSVAARAWIVKNGAASIKTILATNLEDVKRVILAGTDGNLTTPQIARNLRQFYTDRSPSKAMRVARTEVSHAAGFGQREAASQSGIVKTHTWVTSRDDRVRDAHVAMDGETVEFDKSYSNGSVYPGVDDINCRCVESFGTGR